MIASLSITADAPDEVPPGSSFPWVWFGLFFVAAFAILEALMVALELDERMATAWLILISLAGWVYWLFCVSRFHKILQQISRNHYPISSREVVWKHFIPFYNLVWVFRWPAELSNYLNRRQRVKMVSGNLLGVFLLIFLLTGRFIDGGVGLAGTFTVGMYISAKLRKHVELIKGMSPDMLPPLPDPRFFSQPAPVSQLDSRTDATTAPSAKRL
ncbi:MAG TPA: hypothetical protein VGW76_17360 [Pyrinomonadaceae bacterium]|nr:hypothetical protein [Pyrinomonadaceae bacterium]